MAGFLLRSPIHMLIFDTRTFVNGRPRPVIMEDMEMRIERADPRQERIDAIQVCLHYTIILSH
jgi:hypothetical protein